MSGQYNPKVANPWLSNNIVQMRSASEQVPFFFGGAQAPTVLGLQASSFNGSGFSKNTIKTVLTKHTRKLF